MVDLAQNLIRSSNSIKHICCYGIVLMCHNALQIGTVRSVVMRVGHWANLLLCAVFIHEFNLEI
jgi:hypothetical protein